MAIDEKTLLEERKVLETDFNTTKERIVQVEKDLGNMKSNLNAVYGADGQVKTIINVSTSGTNNVVITPANLRGYSTITLNAQGETVTCLFKNSKWNVIAGTGYVLA